MKDKCNECKKRKVCVLFKAVKEFNPKWSHYKLCGKVQDMFEEKMDVFEKEHNKRLSMAQETAAVYKKKYQDLVKKIGLIK